MKQSWASLYWHHAGCSVPVWSQDVFSQCKQSKQQPQTVLSSPQRGLPSYAHLTGAPRGPLDPMVFHLYWVGANASQQAGDNSSIIPTARSEAAKSLALSSTGSPKVFFILLISFSVFLEDLTLLANGLQLCIFVFIITTDRNILSFKPEISLNLERSDLGPYMQGQN